MVTLGGRCQRRTEEFDILRTPTTPQLVAARDQKEYFLGMPLLTIAARQRNGPGPCDTVPLQNLTHKLPRLGFAQVNLLPSILNASPLGFQVGAIEEPPKDQDLVAGHVAGQLCSSIREALDTNGRLCSHTAWGKGSREERER